jgi:two-component system chemotaxis sensor kinase CheA
MAFSPSNILGLTRAAFRQEAEDLLVELDASLLSLESTPTDAELLNRVFRAMHTLKGSGATAGFKEVSTILHDVETVFNDAREGRCAITSPIVDCVLKISDVVRRMMLAPDAAASSFLAEGMASAEELGRLVRPAGAPMAVAPAAAGLVPDEPSSDAGAIWHVSFAPSRGIFHSGNDPLSMLREVLGLGHGKVRVRTSELLAERELDPEQCFLSWDLQVATSEPRERIQEVFAFVEDEATISIEKVAAKEAWVLPPGAYFDDPTIKDFREECEEDVADIEAHVIALEDTPADGDRLDALRRSLHSLKGLTRLLLSQAKRLPPRRHPLRAASELTHAAESFLDSGRARGVSTLDAETAQTLLESVDWLKRLLRDFDAPRDETWPVELLGRLLGPESAAAPSLTPVAMSSARPRSMVLSVADQCDEVVGALARERSAEAVMSPGERKMLTRALRTLGQAATYEGIPALSPRVEVLLALCGDQPAESETSWGAFRVEYESLGAILGGVRAAARPSARPTGRTISIRPSKPPGAERTSVAVPANVGAPAGATGATGATGAMGATGAGAPRSVRVDQTKLDRLMRAIGELLVAKNALPLLAKRVDTDRHAVGKEIKETGDRIAHIADDLQDTMRQIRMMPIKSVFQRFPRMIRDLARSENKQVQLILSGEETELDKTVLEQIGDPLVHLVRNALDHGIESPEERVAAGKPEMGTIGLEMSMEGSHIVIRCSDDGRGMDPSRLRRLVVEKGLRTEAEAAALSDARALELVFLPGFSTAAKVTSLSGRGVGMDVVQSNVRQLRGTIGIQSVLGEGSTISIRLPSSLMVSKGILFECEREQYVMPIESIREMVKLRREDVRTVRDISLANVRGTILPVFSLAVLLGLRGADAGGALGEVEEVSAAIVATRRGDIAVVVDRLVAEIDVIVKPLREGLDQMLVFQGATILGDGRVALILDPAQLDALIGVEPRARSATMAASVA